MSGGFEEHRSKIVFFIVLGIAVVAFFTLRGDTGVLRFREIEPVDIPVVHQPNSYAEFLHYHSAAGTPGGVSEIEVDIFAPLIPVLAQGVTHSFPMLTYPPEMPPVSIDTIYDIPVLRTEEESHVEFTVNVPVAGLYNIRIEYFPVSGRGIDIARELRINGEVPFRGAELITLRRVWGSAAQPDDGSVRLIEFAPATSLRPATYIRQDNQGNQIRPPQEERPRWERAYFTDRLGFFTDPYRFFFEAGENTISLTGVNEPLVMKSLTLVPVSYRPSFAEFRAATNLRENTSDFSTTIQGEWSTVRSSPSLFPLFDNSSGITYPPSVAIITLNMIGGMPWRVPGQWIEWEVEVPEDGLYRVSMSARQNYNRGFVSSRTLSINGEIPFQEVAEIPFRFNNSWELMTLQDDYGNDLLFPMNAGVNTIRMYVTLGDLGEIIDSLLASITRLNSIYREILVLTGPEPDALRDYRIHVHLPHVMDMIYEETAFLYGILLEMEAFLGERNEHTGIITRLIQTLDLFYARPNRIPIRLTNFRQDISAFANSARALTEGPLDIDFFVVSGTSAELPVVNETFFTRASHEIRAFAASFTHDFDSIGDVHGEGATVIDVWITAGRDQATAMKAMIDDTFTPESGIHVNLRLVAHQAVLPAVVAGIGPDVVLGMQLSDPVNYALRNAVVDLSQFPGFYEEVRGRFHHSAWIPVHFEGGYYGMPETQTFNLMFYRSDILEELNLDVPETWSDILAIMPLLQRNNMAIGVPPIGNPMAPDITGFLTQLLQRGGFLYVRDDHPVYEPLSRAALDSEEAIAAFEAFTRFFTHFGSPEFFDPANRFRNGEMPIIFADFTLFNMLSVFAPEIYGAWNFALMPGYYHQTPQYFAGRGGYYNVHHTVPAWGTAAMMIEASEMQDESWEFLKWWTSAETQLRFGREMESIMGEAARFPTANLEAFQILPWSTSQLQVLNEQRDWILGIPEVPGGYYVQRQLINVIRRVVSDNLDTRETLLDVQIVINRELINKRREFGLE
ncbi:MAG: extracellular solute-binding protein [Defluviitaleaceae bacterium]|nr:extracellular solute-binding protein [Defluviitaleaceae bacterium]MCL2263592.1 extracellular solute-binding protein [Defluviitaleaceae bacterium]